MHKPEPTPAERIDQEKLLRLLGRDTIDRDTAERFADHAGEEVTIQFRMRPDRPGLDTMAARAAASLERASAVLELADPHMDYTAFGEWESADVMALLHLYLHDMQQEPDTAPAAALNWLVENMHEQSDVGRVLQTTVLATVHLSLMVGYALALADRRDGARPGGPVEHPSGLWLPRDVPPADDTTHERFAAPGRS